MIKRNMHIPRDKAKYILGLVIVSLIFVALRLKTLNHLLMYDEARNIISLRAFFSNNSANPFYWNYFFHPPLYVTFAGVLAPFKAGFDVRMESLSLLFAYLTLMIVYVMSARLGGRKYAFLSGLFLSLMPASIAYDSWIKRDGLASALGYLAILLLLRRKFLWCAVALSFSMLAKESAVFFIMAATVLLFVLREDGIQKKLAIIYGTIFVLTSWWYVFFSSMPKFIFDIYFSVDKFAPVWANSPLYYCGKLLPDMGLPILIFFITGVGYLIHLIFQEKQYKWAIPPVVALCVYITSSLVIGCKTPWLSLSAVPALAMVAGAGGLYLIAIAKKHKFFPAIFTLFLIFSILGGISFSYEKYHISTYANGWSGANYSKELALYLNKASKDDERLMLTQFSYWGKPFCQMCPVFLYYSDVKPVYIIDGRDSAGEVTKGIVDNKISWLAVIDSPDEQVNFHPLVKSLEDSVLGEPCSVGYSRIWKTDALWRQNVNSIWLKKRAKNK